MGSREMGLPVATFGSDWGCCALRGCARVEGVGRCITLCVVTGTVGGGRAEKSKAQLSPGKAAQAALRHTCPRPRSSLISSASHPHLSIPATIQFNPQSHRRRRTPTRWSRPSPTSTSSSPSRSTRCSSTRARSSRRRRCTARCARAGPRPRVGACGPTPSPSTGAQQRRDRSGSLLVSCPCLRRFPALSFASAWVSGFPAARGAGMATCL